MKTDSVKWFWEWSESFEKAWIVDGEGFTVIGPVLTKEQAINLVYNHNSAVDFVSDQQFEKGWEGGWDASKRDPSPDYDVKMLKFAKTHGIKLA